MGEVPLDGAIREQSDAGVPIVVADADGAMAEIYKSMAERIIAKTRPFT